jgi:hypothetical protein
MTYWILWSVDDREPIMRRGKPHRYYNGVLKPCDPSKRTPFSYLNGWSLMGHASPWTYTREEAMRFPSLAAARAMRRAVFLCFKPPEFRMFHTAEDCYEISKVQDSDSPKADR